MEDDQDCFIAYDVLVFGSKSSPTVWGRFAAYLGRIVCSILPEVGVQIYVDERTYRRKAADVHLPNNWMRQRSTFAKAKWTAPDARAL